MLIGLVGKPSVGKSTFYKAATLAEVEIANYPFTTIHASRGAAYVKVDCAEREFNTKCTPNKGFCIRGNRFVPIELMDVAGLVPGASEGKGLGNQFLNDLRDADSFIQVIDVSGTTDIEGKPTEGHDPSIDIDFLETELDNWYKNIFIKGWGTFARRVDLQGKKLSEALTAQFSGLKVKEYHIEDTLLEVKLPEKCSTWSEDEVGVFVSALRRASKPMVIAANKIDIASGAENYEKLKLKYPHLMIIPCSADSELALRHAAKAGMIEYVPGEKNFKILKELNEKQIEALNDIKKNVLEKYEFGTGVQEVLNRSVFDLLGYLPIFPASAGRMGQNGKVLQDCFLLPGGSTALDFAFFLHTDFGNNFIKAIDARTKRALRKEYKLKARDALEIITR
ncbi:MAG: redox-regulated ATPase YchF [Nanoarchaeota archaeon]|jgi:ribosome-binding ATPase YchF (GTP1/OBG family)|nr:redox-regulated ATPase YchF [Nanoarchaeota archaeon]